MTLLTPLMLDSLYRGPPFGAASKSALKDRLSSELAQTPAVELPAVELTHSLGRGYSALRETLEIQRGVAQPGSAPALGAGCRRFKSSRPDFLSGRDPGDGGPNRREPRACSSEG